MDAGSLPPKSTNRPEMRAVGRQTIGSLSRELALYVVFVTVYYFAVLRFLGGWLFKLSTDNRWLYAFVSLGLMLSQGFVLDVMTSALLKLKKCNVGR